MGTWGPNIYDNDFALDIREEYLTYLHKGLENDIATKKIQEEHELALLDTDDCPIFWTSLADTQWEYGRLLKSVKEKTIEVINKPIDEEYWGVLADKRTKYLNELLDKLNSEQPKMKRIVRRKTKLKSGDIFKFTALVRYFPDGSSEKQFCYGRYITAGIAAFYSTRNIDAEIFQRERKKGLKRSKFNNEPELNDFYKLDIKFIEDCSDGFYNKKYRVIGNLPLEDKFKKPIYFYHRSISSRLCRVFNIWVKHEYKEVDISELDIRIPQSIPKTHEQILKEYGYHVREVNMGLEYMKQLKSLI